MHVTADLAELADRSRDAAADLAERGRGVASDLAADLAQRGRALGADLEERGRALAATIEPPRTVRRRRGARTAAWAVGGLGVGFALGWFVHTRATDAQPVGDAGDTASADEIDPLDPESVVPEFAGAPTPNGQH